MKIETYMKLIEKNKKKKHIMQCRTYYKYYFKINTFYKINI
jgi:hypothetical protein